MAFLSGRMLGNLILASLTSMVGATPYAVAQNNLRILNVEPTVLFPKQEPLRQIAILNVDNCGPTDVSALISYQIAGQQLTQDATFKRGETHQQILVPDISSPAELTIKIT